jgi:hypothetical protein
VVLCIVIAAISLVLVEFAHGVKQKVRGRTKHSALFSHVPINKFVNALSRGVAASDDLRDGFVAEEYSAFRVHDFAATKKDDPVGFAGIDVQRAGLVGLSEHLNHAR